MNIDFNLRLKLSSKNWSVLEVVKKAPSIKHSQLTEVCLNIGIFDGLVVQLKFRETLTWVVFITFHSILKCQLFRLLRSIEIDISGDQVESQLIRSVNRIFCRPISGLQNLLSFSVGPFIWWNIKCH